MDEDHRGYGRGSGRRSRGYNRGRNRYPAPTTSTRLKYMQAPTTTFNNQGYYEEDQYQDSSYKDESNNYYQTSDYHRPRGRPYRGRGGYRSRAAPKTAGGRGRRGRGGTYTQNDSEVPQEPPVNKTVQDLSHLPPPPPPKIPGKEEEDFGFDPKKNYGYSVYKPQQREFNTRDNRPTTAGPPIKYVPDEESKVYYNADDFIQKYDNLPEKTEYLVRKLCDGSLPCSICHNEINQSAAIWSCKQCYQPLHLGCIKRWINKVNADGPTEHNPYENAKEEYDEEGKVVTSGNIKVTKDKDGNIYMQQTNSYTWTCPNCAYNFTEPMPEYNWFCKKEMNPELSMYYLPHSCSKTCNKSKNQLCLHSNCNIECHPGAWVPCEEFVEISCYCGKATRTVTCHVRSQKQQYSCRDICGKTLECFNHICEEPCHEGNCSPCKEKETLTCYWGKEEMKVDWGNSGTSCGNIWGKMLECGEHYCQKQCHFGNWGECEYLPEKIKFCPCGRTSLKKMGNEGVRTSCKDEIPTCKAICGKMLPCKKHHCSKACHQGPCNLCDEVMVDICRCGRGQRKCRCFQVNFPIESITYYGDKVLKKVQEFKLNPFIWNKKCSKLKSCKKHRCQKMCCPVTTRDTDVDGSHICLESCQKDLAWGKHKWVAFCHIGPCEPCAVFTNQPMKCPCGMTTLQPPIRWGERPYCVRRCSKIHEECGHSWGQQCHPGECFPCTEGVSKVCTCEKVKLENVKWGEKNPSCGHICHELMPCGHRCPKMCHDHKSFMESGATKEGCGQKWNKTRANCVHKCQDKCHSEKECSDVPCDAEVKIFCKCGFRFINGICNRYVEGFEETEESKLENKLEWNAEWMKNKRDSQIAKAFSKGDVGKQKELKADYYPEYLIEFAKTNLKLVGKVEKILEEIIKNQTTMTLPDIEGEFLSPIANLVREHYFWELVRYGGRFKNAKRVTDVYYKDENSKIPSTLLSDYVKLIKDGVLSSKASDRKEKLFEASIKIPNMPIGSSLEDIKRNLIGFHSEFYTEKVGSKSGYYFHFYNKFRAEEAYEKLRSAAGGFTGVDLILHGEDKKANKLKKKKKKTIQKDFIGFQEV